MPADRSHGPDVIAPPPLLYVAPFLAGRLLDAWLQPPGLPRAARRAGRPLIALGVGLSASFVGTMRRAGTPLDPRRAPSALVTRGPFRRTRNPGYLGLALVYAGVALASNSRSSLALLPAVIATVDRGVIRREERYLEQRFGAEYRSYAARVPRWL